MRPYLNCAAALLNKVRAFLWNSHCFAYFLVSRKKSLW